jgi:cobalt-zinc-cadmium efflux system outer membrane protein
LEFERESGAHSGFSEAQFTLILSKAVELGGKRVKRIRLAQREKDLAAWDYEVARANVMKEVAQAFINVVTGQERVALEQELVSVAQGTSDTIRKLSDAGEVSPLELAKSETALSLAQIKLEQVREALASARARLAATWGGALAEFDRAEGELADTRPVPPLEDLVDRIAKNPDLARWADELEQRSAVIDLAKAKRIPNVTISAGLRRTGLGSRDMSHLGLGPGTQWNAARSQIDNDADAENTLYLGLSMPLPIFDRNQGAIQEARHRASKASEERRASENQLRASLAKAYHSLQAAYVTSTTLAEKVLPNSTHTFESITKGYEQGEFSYLDVLDAQRTMFEARNQYLDALAAYHENAVEVERLTGTALWSEDDVTNSQLEHPSK